MEAAKSKVALSGQSYETRLRQLGATANTEGTLTITAPIAGTVADREITQGESGDVAGKKVLTIINGSNVQMSGNLYEKDLESVRVGQSVRIKVNGIPNRVFAGQISVMGSVVQGESRVVPVKVELENENLVLKPGMFGEMEVLTDRTSGSVIAIPKSAIVETNDKKTIVFVQNGNAFEPVAVTIGQESGDWIEVKKGLVDGDQVVTQRAPQLYTQTLRGVPAKEESGHPAPSPTPSIGLNSPSLPWWLMVPGIGALGGGLFWAGSAWSTRRYRQIQPIDPLPALTAELSEEETHPHA